MTYPTANNAVKRLVEDDALRETTGQQQYQEFQADEVLDVLNRPAEEIPAPGELISNCTENDDPED